MLTLAAKVFVTVNSTRPSVSVTCVVALYFSFPLSSIEYTILLPSSLYTGSLPNSFFQPVKALRVSLRSMTPSAKSLILIEVGLFASSPSFQTFVTLSFVSKVLVKFPITSASSSHLYPPTETSSTLYRIGSPFSSIAGRSSNTYF